MKRVKITAIVFGLLSACTIAAAQSSGAQVGEVRTFAVRQGDLKAQVQMKRDGWLEADGQVLNISEYRELYLKIGRAWTGHDVAESRFAVPRLHDSTQPTVSSDNVYGVLGPGDVLAAGRRPVISRNSPITYWIFAGDRTTVTASDTSH
jgi:hypothetical protein